MSLTPPSFKMMESLQKNLTLVLENLAVREAHVQAKNTHATPIELILHSGDYSTGLRI